MPRRGRSWARIHNVTKTCAPGCGKSENGARADARFLYPPPEAFEELGPEPAVASIFEGEIERAVEWSDPLVSIEVGALQEHVDRHPFKARFVRENSREISPLAANPISRRR